MAGRSHTDWDFFLRLLGLGMRPTDAVTFVGVKLSTPYNKAHRDPVFHSQMEAAGLKGHNLKIISPDHWVDERGRPILDNNFDPIPREPPGQLVQWLRRNRNPLASLAA